MKRIIKKFLAMVCCVTVVFAMFTGCGAQKEGSTTSTTDTAVSESKESDDSKKDVTLTLLIDNQTPLDGLQGVIDAFEAKTGIKTEIELRPGGDEGENLIKTRLATGEMADLIYFNSGSLLNTLNPEQYFVDLTNEPYVSTFDEAYKVTVTVNGKVFGAPAGSSFAGAWLYNKKVYDELGLEVPKTWEQLLENCEKIKAAGKIPVAASYKDDWTAQLVLLGDNYNVLVEEPDFPEKFTANQAKFATTPAALRSFEKQQELFIKGYVNEDLNTTTYDMALKMLSEGTAVHYPIITNALPNIDKNYPDKINDIGVFGQPGNDPNNHGITIWLPNSIYIYKDGQHIEEAKQWVEFLVSPEGVAAMAAKEKAVGPYVIKGADLPEDAYPAVKEMMTYFDEGKTAPALEFLTPLKGPNSPQICVQNGNAMTTPAESAAQYDKDVEKQAKQLGMEGW